MATYCGNYLILRKLGTGGFADVFLAKELTTNDYCALKVMVRTENFDVDFENFMKEEIYL